MGIQLEMTGIDPGIAAQARVLTLKHTTTFYGM
jgi:hypothetical protein